MTTIKDVAKKAGVSISTVSRVLTSRAHVNEETKEKVIKVIEELNFKPNLIARGLKERRTNTIGLIIPDISNPYYPKIAKSVEDYAKQLGYAVILCNTYDNLEEELKYVDMLKKRYIDGIIFITASKDGKHIKNLMDENFPVVQLDRFRDANVPSVVSDNINGAYEATKYLIENGHKKIACVIGNTNNQIFIDRFIGCMMALNENNIKVPDEFVIKDANTLEEVHESVMELLKNYQHPTAIFSSSDQKSFGIYRAIRDCGLKVPDDISVIGYDNVDLAKYLDPPLTTYDQSVKEMGVLAVKRLIEQIESSSKIGGLKSVLKGSIVIRQSVKKIDEANRDIGKS